MKKRSELAPETGTRLARSAEVTAKDAINQAFALFNRRWALRILWELRHRSMAFRELQVACGGLSSSVLNARLSELRDALLVQHQDGSGYTLSESGRALLDAMKPLLLWAPAWATSVAASRKANARPTAQGLKPDRSR